MGADFESRASRISRQLDGERKNQSVKGDCNKLHVKIGSHVTMSFSGS